MRNVSGGIGTPFDYWVTDGNLARIRKNGVKLSLEGE